MTLHRPLVRALVLAALSVLTLLVPMRPAVANDYSDVWITVGEEGWGVSILQWGNTMFASFFIYGPDNKPIWYVAVMNYDGVRQYTGTLYAEQGTFFQLPWVPSEQIESVAGTAIFRPSAFNNFQGTLIYTVNNGMSVNTITKAVQRLTVASVPLDGVYFGGISDTYAGCSDSGNNGKYFDYFRLQVTQSAGSALSMSFAFTSDLTCTISGTMAQNGLLYGIGNATYLCSDQTDTTAVLSDVKMTAQGIEGQFSASNAHGGCQETARFSAARF